MNDSTFFDGFRQDVIGKLELRNLSEGTQEFLKSTYFRGHEKLEWLFDCQAGLRYIATALERVPSDERDIELIRGMFIEYEFSTEDPPNEYTLKLFRDDSLFIDNNEFDAYARVYLDYKDALRDWRRGLGVNGPGFPGIMARLAAYIATTGRQPDYRLPDEP